MSDEGSGIGCLGATVIVIIILLIFGLISLGDIWNVITVIWNFCGAVCIGISVFIVAIVFLILGWRYFDG